MQICTAIASITLVNRHAGIVTKGKFHQMLPKMRPNLFLNPPKQALTQLLTPTPLRPPPSPPNRRVKVPTPCLGLTAAQI